MTHEYINHQSISRFKVLNFLLTTKCFLKHEINIHHSYVKENETTHFYSDTHDHYSIKILGL